MYRTCFNRAPDPAGLAWYMKGLRSGRLTLIEIAQFLVASEEFQSLYDANPAPATLVAAFYRNATGWAPDPADYRAWVDYLTENSNSKPAKAAAAIGIPESLSSVAG
jgi:hypothetical protein